MKFAHSLGLGKSTCTIETYLRPLIVHSNGDEISVEMGAAFDLHWDIPLSIDDTTQIVHHVNTGVPHAVLFTDDIEAFDLNTLGPKVRHHLLFAPKGVNFNVAQVKEDGTLWNRTFERGVEGETLACGTGCAAVAVAANQMLGLQSPIKVRTRSGEFLTISFENPQESVVMTGPATKVFTGEFTTRSTNTQ
jgi:diaminopimelate epimerase